MSTKGACGAGQPQPRVERAQRLPASPGPSVENIRKPSTASARCQCCISACGSSARCSIMLAHSSSAPPAASCGGATPADRAPRQRRGDHQRDALRAWPRCSDAASRFDAQHLRLRIGLRSAAPATPPLKLHQSTSVRGCRRITRQPLGHAPRHLAVQPGRARRRGAMRRAISASASACTGRDGSCAAASAGMGGQYIEPMHVHRPARVRARCAGPVRGVPRLGHAAACAPTACDASRAPVPRCRRCGLRLAAGRADVRRLPARPAAVRRAASSRCDYALPVGPADRRLQVQRAASSWPRRWRSAAGAPSQRDAPRRCRSWVLPVPLAPQRLAERGYNQAWELARRAGAQRWAAAPMPQLLRAAARHGAHQAELTAAQRQTQPARRLRASNPRRRASLHGRHVALVDDVMTSGATLREAAAALRARRRGACRCLGAGAHAGDPAD